jgi:hypothetical protein
MFIVIYHIIIYTYYKKKTQCLELMIIEVKVLELFK